MHEKNILIFAYFNVETFGIVFQSILIPNSQLSFRFFIDDPLYLILIEGFIMHFDKFLMVIQGLKNRLESIGYDKILPLLIIDEVFLKSCHFSIRKTSKFTFQILWQFTIFLTQGEQQNKMHVFWLGQHKVILIFDIVTALISQLFSSGLIDQEFSIVFASPKGIFFLRHTQEIY